MRQFLLSAAKILVSAALLYLALRKVNLTDLASRINNLASLGWIGLAIATTFLRFLSASCAGARSAQSAVRRSARGRRCAST